MSSSGASAEARRLLITKSRHVLAVRPSLRELQWADSIRCHAASSSARHQPWIRPPSRSIARPSEGRCDGRDFSRRQQAGAKRTGEAGDGPPRPGVARCSLARAAHAPLTRESVTLLQPTTGGRSNGDERNLRAACRCAGRNSEARARTLSPRKLPIALMMSQSRPKASVQSRGQRLPFVTRSPQVSPHGPRELDIRLLFRCGSLCSHLCFPRSVGREPVQTLNVGEALVGGQQGGLLDACADSPVRMFQGSLRP